MIQRWMIKDILLILVSGISVISGVSASEKSADDKSRIHRACPGVAAWDREHANDSTVNMSGEKKRPAAPGLRDQLLVLAAQDQAAREAVVGMPFDVNSPAFKKIEKVDAVNLAKLKEMVRENNVLTSEKVGLDGMKAFWLLVQHADSDIDLQEKVLRSFLSPISGVEPSEVAMLTDRIKVAKGQPQIYGTQFREVDGKMVPFEIEKIQAVDIRRRKMDLMPLSAYTCVITEMYLNREN